MYSLRTCTSLVGEDMCWLKPIDVVNGLDLFKENWVPAWVERQTDSSPLGGIVLPLGWDVSVCREADHAALVYRSLKRSNDIRSEVRLHQVLVALEEV